MEYRDEKTVLKENGITAADWAVLITAGYYVPLPRKDFIPHAVWEVGPGHPVTEAEVAASIDNCLARGWIKLTAEGHVEPDRNIFGEVVGKRVIYPQEGIILTESGHELHRKVAFGIFGQEYFKQERKM